MGFIDAKRRRSGRYVWPVTAAGLLICFGPAESTAHLPTVHAEHAPAGPTTATELDTSLRPRQAADAPERADVPSGFHVKGQPARLSVQALPVLPGEKVSLSAPPNAPSLRYGAGRAQPTGPGRWQWTAPQAPGIYALELSAGTDTVTVTALVMHPASEVRDGLLNGYRIGRYLSRPLRGDPAYVPPRGFIEVRATDHEVLVSPHFTLGQFVCKEKGEPRYVALSVPLLVKLEALSDRLAGMGYARRSLKVMSGFRTPAYNREIGNTTVYSRHLWGDAADVYVDADGDGRMDDLDGDGTSGVGDARVLYRVAESVASKPGVRPGGLGLYGSTAAHGPFVHVDARGREARW